MNFLRKLRNNNERTWFQSHKAEYEASVKGPLLKFATDLSGEVGDLAPEYATTAEKAVQRIYRDVRFSADKTLYRTELGVLFTHRDLGKKAGTGIYIGIAAESATIAGGLYQQEPSVLYAVREHLAQQSDLFEQLISRKDRQKTFGTLAGNLTKRPPRGFVASHPKIELLMRTQWLLERKMQLIEIKDETFFADVLAGVQLLIPFVRFFEPPLLKQAKPQVLG